MRAIFANSLDYMMAADAEFKEEQHKRDQRGKFARQAGQSTEEAHRAKGPDGKHSGEWNEPTKQLHESIAQKLLEGKQASGKRPTAYILGGGSASGKTTGFNNMFAKEMRDKLLHLDSDAIKKMIPEYEQLKKDDPENAAALVHEESSYITKKVMAAATAKKLDFLYDSTGAGNSIPDMAKNLKSEGYDVHMIYFDTDIDVARERAHERGVKTGRHIPEDVIQKSHHGSAKNFTSMAEGVGRADTMSLYDNSGPKGSVPVLVYQKKGKEPGMIVDGKKWDVYREKGKNAPKPKETSGEVKK